MISNEMTEENDNHITNTDLSFLEDIDIDGIVEYLNETDKILSSKRKLSETSKLLLSQDSNQNKRLKIELSESQNECNRQCVHNKECLFNTQFLNANIDSISNDCNSNNTDTPNFQKCENNKQIHSNPASRPCCDIIINNKDNQQNSDNSNTTDIKTKKKEKTLISTVIEFVTDDIKKYDTQLGKSKETVSLNTSLIPKPENIVYNTKDLAGTEIIYNEVDSFITKTSGSISLLQDSNEILKAIKSQKQDTIEKSKLDVLEYPNLSLPTGVVLQKGETKSLLNDSKEVLKCNESQKQNSLEGNKLDLLKYPKLASPLIGVVEQKEDSNTLSNSCNEILQSDKPQKRDYLEDNKSDVPNNSKPSSAIISVVVRKDDLNLAHKIQQRLYQFLRVKFTVLNVFHNGKYSKILECQHKGKKYALKIINHNSHTKTFSIEKGKMLDNLQRNIPRHQLNFVYLYASFGLENQWCFLFDFYPTNLREKLKYGPMDINTVEDLFRQLVIALNSLRSQQIIHADIKPDHILLNHSNTILKLCGFDRAYYHTYEKTILPNVGTPSYRAPEVILGCSASFGIDIWSSGLVIYEMMTGERLFPGCFNNDILYKQMCILGNMPFDMIINSVYGCNHFLHRSFLKREGYLGQEIRVIKNFFKNNSFKSKPYKKYNKYWRYATSKSIQKKDVQKISSIMSVIEKMLVLHPDKRVPIEILYDDPLMLQSYY